MTFIPTKSPNKTYKINEKIGLEMKTKCDNYRNNGTVSNDSRLEEKLHKPT
jgi:hypothetical protein